MSTVMVDSDVWSASHDCWDFRESSSACRPVSCDSIQMTSLRSRRVGEQQLHAAQAGLLRPDAGAVVDDLRGDVLGAAVGGAQHPDLLQRGHRLAELPARHPHHHPHVGGVALGVGLGGLVGDLAALRVDDALHVLAGRPDVLPGERDGAVGDDRALQLRGGRAVLPARRVGRPGGVGRRAAGVRAPGELPDELPDEPLDVSLDVSPETSPETASLPLSSAEQAASRAVMVRAVRSPAVRERVAVRVMAVRRRRRAGRFRP